LKLCVNRHDAFGSNAGSNVGSGISLLNAPGNFVCNNLISGNGSTGISILGAGGGGNQIFGNFLVLALDSHKQEIPH
jgi:parallel beta-helix repeat protein